MLHAFIEALRAEHSLRVRIAFKRALNNLLHHVGCHLARTAIKLDTCRLVALRVALKSMIMRVALLFPSRVDASL